MGIKLTKAKRLKTSAMTKKEKGPVCGDHAPPTKSPRKFPPIGPAKQYGQKSLEPVHKTHRGGNR